jgi:hypothetical protein
VTTAPQTPTGQLLQLNTILQSAVYLNWPAFGQASDEGMVQLEYHVGAEQSIEYLKIWSATSRGYLSLVCDYAVAAHRPNGAGARFANGFHCRDLARFLDSILMNQNLFAHDSPANSNVVIQVKPPSEEQLAQSKERFSEALSLVAPPPRPSRSSKAAASRIPELPEMNA